jgi:hypothetical protein
LDRLHHLPSAARCGAAGTGDDTAPGTGHGPGMVQPTPYTGASPNVDVRGTRVSSPGLARRRVGG